MSHAVFSSLESSVHAVKLSHDVGMVTVNAEAVKGNFKFELRLKSFARCDRHRADTWINIKATCPVFSA